MPMDHRDALAVAGAQHRVRQVGRGLRLIRDAVENGVLGGTQAANLRKDPLDPMPPLRPGLEFR